MLQGLNHLTLAVADLERAFAFYSGVLSATPRARWAKGAYLSLADLWLCLSLSSKPIAPASNYSHYAFSVSAVDFDVLCQGLRAAGVVEWQPNRSEGDSFYFLDPDGHQLELHVGDLASRLASCRLAPYPGMVFFDESPLRD